MRGHEREAACIIDGCATSPECATSQAQRAIWHLKTIGGAKLARAADAFRRSAPATPRRPATPLPLLPSGPGGVHGLPSRGHRRGPARILPGQALGNKFFVGFLSCWRSPRTKRRHAEHPLARCNGLHDAPSAAFRSRQAGSAPDRRRLASGTTSSAPLAKPSARPDPRPDLRSDLRSDSWPSAKPRQASARARGNEPTAATGEIRPAAPPQPAARRAWRSRGRAAIVKPCPCSSRYSSHLASM